MKHIYLNLKRFDIPPELGGVNRIAPPREWGQRIVSQTQDAVKAYDEQTAEFVMYFPEGHLITALDACGSDSLLQVGCQSIFWEDTEKGRNFGAFTSSRTANSMMALGCTHTIIGHCEERKRLASLFKIAGATNDMAVNVVLNLKVQAAINAGMKVLFCIGESEEEHDQWQDVLKKQLKGGLNGLAGKAVIAYEPLWSIGPGKEPAGKEHITQTARFIKEVTGGSDVVYGGGLKEDNAEMLASIEEIDGGLIALTRFSGDIGFYPDEYLKIVKLYLERSGIKAGLE